MRTLAEWLTLQESVHPKTIDMGLARVSSVARTLGVDKPSSRVITVGGTNGKGSTVAHLDALLRAAGASTGMFTSPHFLRYNERIRVDGVEVEDAELIGAFERIDAARGSITLTFFEFNALAALVIFADRRVEVAILEVGLGGRLDAANLIDADVAVVCSIGFDHRDYLGDTLELIGAEKAGIFRAGRPAVLSTPAMPSSVYAAIEALGARGVVAERDFGWEVEGEPNRASVAGAVVGRAGVAGGRVATAGGVGAGLSATAGAAAGGVGAGLSATTGAAAGGVGAGLSATAGAAVDGVGAGAWACGARWSYRGLRVALANLPPSALAGSIQYRNASAALAAIESLDAGYELSEQTVSRGLRDVRIAGRFQVVPGSVEWILDIAHNEPAAQVFAGHVRERPMPTVGGGTRDATGAQGVDAAGRGAAVGAGGRGGGMAARGPNVGADVGRGAAGADARAAGRDAAGADTRAAGRGAAGTDTRAAGRTFAVVGILADKDAREIAAALAPLVDHWVLCTLPGARGSTAADLANRLALPRGQVTLANSVEEGCEAARAATVPGDRVLVFGSVYTVGPALRWLRVY